MRLIDIDKAFKNLSQMYEEADGSKKRALRFLLDMILTIPTISPDSLRPKGRWEKVPPYTAIDGGWHKAVICSECKTHYVSDGNTPWSMHNFCAHCGADMREV